MSPPPLAALKLQLALVALALALALVGGFWSHRHAGDAAAHLAQQRQALNGARQTLERSRQEQALVGSHLAAYQALVARGFVGAEDRLAWIEAAQHANRAAGLYGLSYRLSPRAPADTGLAGSLPLGRTTMTLVMPILVESDLPRFLAAFAARAPGMVRIERCRLGQAQAGPFEAVNRPRLQAECDLVWFTVDNTGEKS